jgi:hypothetical protein
MSEQRLDVLDDGRMDGDRRARLEASADGLTGRGGVPRHQHLLMAISAALVVVGLVAIILGWLGSSRTAYTQEQTPYLISGGLLGVALAVIGSVTFFAHWLTVLIRDGRAHERTRAADLERLIESQAALLTAVTRLADRLESTGVTKTPAPRKPRASRTAG